MVILVYSIIAIVLTGLLNAAREFQLSDPADKSYYFGVNSQTDTVINVCLNSTYHFVEHIMKHLINLHKVMSYILILTNT